MSEPTPPIDHTTLPNGLTVVTRALAGPAEAVYLWFDVGSADEGPHEHGLAHFLEHMVFKGTTRRPVGRAAAEIEALGGDLNAWTSTDHTVLHASCSAGGWREVLDVLADMVTDSRFDAEDFERERQVILEEIRTYDDDPDSVLSERVQAALWGEHPYARRILGESESVRAHTPELLRAFFQRHYTAGRAILAVAGPVTHDEVHQAAQAALGALPTGAAREPLPAAPERPAQPLVRVRGEFASTGVELTWLLPPAGHPDLPALDVANQLLGQGAGASLVDHLQREHELAFGVWSELDLARCGSTFTIGFIPRGEGADEAVRRTLAAVDRLAQTCASRACTRARAALLADYLFAEETVDGIAQGLAWYTAHLGSPHARDQQRAALEAVQPHDVSRAVRRWLTPDRVTIGALDEHAHDEALLNALRPAAATTRRREPVHKVRENGARLLIVPEDHPLVAVRIVTGGGELRVPPRQAGIAAAWTRAALAGAGDLDALRLGELIDDLAAQVDPTVSRHSLGFAASAPATEALDLLDLLGDLVLDPHCAGDEFEHIREELLDDLRTLGDRPSQLATDLIRQRRWPGHPWRLPPSGTHASLGALSPQRVRKFHDQHFTGPNTVVVVSGGIDPDEVEAALAWLDDLPSEAVPLPARVATTPTLSGAQTIVGGHEQALVTLAGVGQCNQRPADRALELATAVLDGQGGRLFLRLREEAALAYDVWASSFEGVDGGTFSAGLAVDPERLDEAATRLRGELQRLADEPPTPEELRRATRMLSGRRALDAQRSLARASDLAQRELFGLPTLPETYRAHLEAVTAEQVSAAIRQVIEAGLLEVRVRP